MGLDKGKQQNGKKSSGKFKYSPHCTQKRFDVPFLSPVIEDNTPEKKQERKLYSKPRTWAWSLVCLPHTAELLQVFWTLLPCRPMRAASHWPSREAAPLRRQPTARNGSTRMVLFPICSFFVCFKRELLFYVCMYFILFWHGWVFLAVAGLSLVAAIGSYSLFRCFSLRQLLL